MPEYIKTRDHFFRKDNFIRAEKKDYAGLDIMKGKEKHIFKTEIHIKDSVVSLSSVVNGTPKELLISTYNSKEEQEKDYDSLLSQVEEKDEIKPEKEKEEVNVDDKPLPDQVDDSLSDEYNKAYKQLEALEVKRQGDFITAHYSDYPLSFQISNGYNTKVTDYQRVDLSLYMRSEELKDMDLSMIEPYKQEGYSDEYVGVPIPIVSELIAKYKEDKNIK